MGSPAGGEKFGLMASTSAWSHVVMTPEKMSARTHAAMLRPVVGSVDSGTLWKNDMAPRQKGTCMNVTPSALSVARSSVENGMSPDPKSLYGA